MEKPINWQPGQQVIGDRLFIDKLNAIKNYEIRQGNPFLEGITGGIWANTYIISDMDRMVQVEGRPKDKPVPTPVFMVKEDSNCCTRCFCPGNQSFIAKVYHAMPAPIAGKEVCGCCYAGHQYQPDANAGVAMTIEREGCCSKALGCFAFANCCLEEVFYHNGDVDIKPGTTKEGDGTYFARAKMPKYGGGCTPELHLEANGQQFSTLQGPSCFGGWLSVCFDTIFFFSKEKNKNGEYGQMKKRRIHSCGDLCREMFTDVDQFEYNAGPAFPGATNEQKAALLGEVVHLDFMFFENDLPPCYLDSDDQGNAVLVCTFFQIYCYGCCCPVQICIPLGGGN
eukprot:m.481279 g.481279  ORF g.481279 m.481279 type:complete len:339 (+) comp22114_c0_seq1:271-1287(+)